LDDKVRTFVRNAIGVMPLISPQLARFEGQAEGYPSVHIPISHLSRPVREIESLGQKFVLYYAAEDDCALPARNARQRYVSQNKKNGE
jgi:hypothetical protein